MTQNEFFDRRGHPITLLEWAESFETRRDLKRVAKTTLPNGLWVSTVWLGVNNRFGEDGPPLIFETMVFQGRDLHEMDCEQYSSEAEALAGHDRMCLKWSTQDEVTS